MDRIQASFEIDSKSDAHATRRILEGLYDRVREESQTIRERSDDTSELLDQFERLRDAAERPAPGRLTVTYERADDHFED
jgi:hypothetical protein